MCLINGSCSWPILDIYETTILCILTWMVVFSYQYANGDNKITRQRGSRWYYGRLYHHASMMYSCAIPMEQGDCVIGFYSVSNARNNSSTLGGRRYVRLFHYKYPAGESRKNLHTAILTDTAPRRTPCIDSADGVRVRYLAAYGSTKDRRNVWYLVNNIPGE